MGIRRTVLETVISILDGLVVDGKSIRVIDDLFDLEGINYEELPKFSIVPAPENDIIEMGTQLTATYKLGMQGVVGKSSDGSLVKAGTDIIDAIVEELLSEEVAQDFCNAGFGLSGIGPTVIDAMGDSYSGSDRAYVAIMLNFEFLQ